MVMMGMTEKRFTDIEVGAGTGRVRLYNGINFVEYSSSELLDLLNEQHETINKLKIENRELNNEVKLLCEFFRNSDFILDDFNKWLTEDKWKWKAKEVLEERFGDLND